MKKFGCTRCQSTSRMLATRAVIGTPWISNCKTSPRPIFKLSAMPFSTETGIGSVSGATFPCQAPAMIFSVLVSSARYVERYSRRSAQPGILACGLARSSSTLCPFTELNRMVTTGTSPCNDMPCDLMSSPMLCR